MKALLRQPSHYDTFESRPIFGRQPEYLPRQPHRRTLSWQITLSYPSPPMSSPPSPQRKPIDDLPPTTTSNFANLSLTATSNISYNPDTAVCLPPITTEAQAHSLSPTYGPVSLIESGTITAPPQPLSRGSVSSSESQPQLYRTESASSANAALDVQTTAGPSTASLVSSASRGGRRSKSHVANACNNCKRAHLSCDVERPCNRCVQTGKGETCQDVPHKKRGRPRLRDEGDFRMRQPGEIVPEAGASETGLPPPSSGGAPARGHRRKGSLRTLRSYSDASSHAPVPNAAPSSVLGPAFAPQPQISRPTGGFVTPIAFLDLDLVIMKANAPFQDLMGIQDIRGVRLTDIARTLEGDSFQNARNALRAEREAKEPSYLPPILQPGLDPVSGITDQDIAEISRGFDDQHYTWTFRLMGGERNLGVTMRLAKTSLYFITLFLPPLPEAQTEQIALPPPGPPPQTTFFQPAMPHPSTFQSSPQRFAEPSLAASPHQIPPSHFYLPHNTYPGGFAPPSVPPSQPGSKSYPPFPPQPGGYYPPPHASQHQHSQQHMFHPPPPPQPLQTIQERPQTAGSVGSVGSAPSPYIAASPYLPSFSGRPRSDTLDSLGRHVQSRLRADSGVTSSVISQSSPSHQPIEFSRTSSDESNDSATAAAQSPRKRRRMNLDEVLHQR